jgi:hypothetical protein
MRGGSSGEFTWDSLELADHARVNGEAAND